MGRVETGGRGHSLPGEARVGLSGKSLDVVDDPRPEPRVIFVQPAGVKVHRVCDRAVDRVVGLEHDHIPEQIDSKE